MKKSAETLLLDFLKANPSKWASGDLQRREWRNKNGTLATPRSLVRRLEENTFWETDTQAHKKNLNGILIATYQDNTTYYQIKEGHEKKETINYIVHPLTGQRMTTQQFALTT